LLWSPSLWIADRSLVCHNTLCYAKRWLHVTLATRNVAGKSIQVDCWSIIGLS
jgi:hypothetical protein